AIHNSAPSIQCCSVLLLLAVQLIFFFVLFSVPKVEVDSGIESVQLPVEIKAHLPKDIKVEWKDGSYRKIHIYQNGSDQFEEQDKVYRDRTEIDEDLLNTGDLKRDSGEYRCVVKTEEIKRYKTVFLIVKGLFVCLFVCLFFLSDSLSFYLQHLRLFIYLLLIMIVAQELGVRLVIGRLPIRAPAWTVSVVVSLSKTLHPLPTGGGQRARWRQCPAASPLSVRPRVAVATM
uniref:Ig-like domain-containing protein n=1 Tax=Astatotilapia calliptera TaxID=8154 RepID=A0A3P8PCX1_ASTCA